MIEVFLSVLLLVAGGTEPPSNPCTCATPSFDEQITQADLIFEGVALKTQSDLIKQLEGLDVNKPPGFGDTKYVFFYTATVWKGRKKHDYIVSTSENSAGCGYPFKEGRRYLVYARVRDAEASTDLCTRTIQSSEADEDREKLNDLFAH